MPRGRPNWSRFRQIFDTRFSHLACKQSANKCSTLILATGNRSCVSKSATSLSGCRRKRRVGRASATSFVPAEPCCRRRGGRADPRGTPAGIWLQFMVQTETHFGADRHSWYRTPSNSRNWICMSREGAQFEPQVGCPSYSSDFSSSAIQDWKGLTAVFSGPFHRPPPRAPRRERRPSEPAKRSGRATLRPGIFSSQTPSSAPTDDGDLVVFGR